MSLEQLKCKTELLRVQSAKAEMEYIIAQRNDEIKRLLENIANQELTETKLLEKLKGLIDGGL